MPANPNHGGLWTDQVWQNIDASVNTAAMANCISQQVFPATQMSDVLSVPADSFNPGPPPAFTQGDTRPYLELSVNFTLSNGQVNGDPTGQMAIRFATIAATQLAGAVDGIFFGGPGYVIAAPIVLSSGRIFDGLIALGTRNYVVPYPPSLPGNPANNTGISILQAVQQGIGILTGAGKGQTPPFALILGSTPVGGAATTAKTLTDGSQINGVATTTVLTPLLPGGIFGATALDGNKGLLVALGGDATTIFYSDNMLTELVTRNNDGSFLFRVFYRIQIAPSDGRAFVVLDFP
jgi:hypothetical protein